MSEYPTAEQIIYNPEINHSQALQLARTALSGVKVLLEYQRKIHPVISEDNQKTFPMGVILRDWKLKKGRVCLGIP